MAMRSLKIVLKVMIGFLIAICLVILYAFKIEPSRTVVHSYDMNGNDGEALKVVQLSDIQVSETYTIQELNKLVKKVNKLKPDILVFTGDLYENFAAFHQKNEVTESLSKLTAKYGKYAIWGNRDYGGGAVTVYEDILLEADFTLLKNSGVLVSIHNDKKVFIGGLDDALLGNPNVNRTIQVMDDNSEYKIVLMHEPDMADLFKDTSANLLLAGHSHGGQVKIPFVDLMSTSKAKKYNDGFYTINESTNMKLYVNTGIGTSHLPVRFMVPPEISIFNIHL